MRSPGRPSTWSRLAWFAALWVCSVTALGLVALVIRTMLRA
jgi:hypothetical protein